MGPWSIISGITTVAMLPPAVDAATRQQAVRLVARLAGADEAFARLIRRADRSSKCRTNLEKVIIAMARVLMAAREVA
jgi:hypothetical protein